MGLKKLPARTSSAKEPKTVAESKSSVSSAKKTKRTKKIPTKLTAAEIEQTILDHYEHGKRLAWSFLTAWRMRMNEDEVASVVGAALCEAASRFDPSKQVQFKTFFFYHLRGMLLKEMTRIIQEQRLVYSLPYMVVTGATTTERWVLPAAIFSLVDNNNPEKLLAKRELSNMCWDACSQLDELEQQIIVRHYVHDEPLVDIAKDLDYCRCHVSRVKSRALKKLEKLLGTTLKSDKGRGQMQRVAPRRPDAAKRRKAEAQALSYTGGRGRRRGQARDAKADKVETFLKKVCNG